eukprot:1309944-Ditylum_brightwellii.AAC.1
MVMLVMTALDEGHVVCMHSFNLFCCYSSVGTDALEGHTLVFVEDTINRQMPVLFSITTGAGRTASERTLDHVRGAAAPSFAPLAAHYVSLGHANGLAPSDVGGTPAPVQDLPHCLLIPTAWASLLPTCQHFASGNGTGHNGSTV